MFPNFVLKIGLIFVNKNIPCRKYQRIVSAVSQAVLASLNGGGIADLSPPSSAVETRELPIVASGITSSADATMQGPVASALTHLSGETNFIQVTPSPDPGLPKFNSINVPIDANVSTKIKAFQSLNQLYATVRPPQLP